jgi:NAD(P)-dependent dehydrogenase (short-subunit alcohol dehydrogenase family)
MFELDDNNRWNWNWRLQDRVALITGASSGMGAEVARAFGRARARVVAVGRDPERLAATEATINEDGGEVLALAAELTTDGAAAQVVEASLERWSRIDVLLHIAGIFQPGEFAASDVSGLDAQYEINVRVPYMLTGEAIPHMPEGSSVVFIGSNITQVGMPGTAAYSASKGAVHALTTTLAAELADRRIRVNNIAPGTVLTPMTAGVQEDEALRATHLGKVLVGRLGTVEDVAAAALYFASPHSGYVTGATLIMDGGAIAAW